MNNLSFYLNLCILKNVLVINEKYIGKHFYWWILIVFDEMILTNCYSYYSCASGFDGVRIYFNTDNMCCEWSSKLLSERYYTGSLK